MYHQGIPVILLGYTLGKAQIQHMYLDIETINHSRFDTRNEQDLFGIWYRYG